MMGGGEGKGGGWLELSGRRPRQNVKLKSNRSPSECLASAFDAPIVPSLIALLFTAVSWPGNLVMPLSPWPGSLTKAIILTHGQ